MICFDAKVGLSECENNSVFGLFSVRCLQTVAVYHQTLPWFLMAVARKNATYCPIFLRFCLF